jgi:hypothetical protein
MWRRTSCQHNLSSVLQSVYSTEGMKDSDGEEEDQVSKEPE